jgi:hypothetical protein
MALAPRIRLDAEIVDPAPVAVVPCADRTNQRPFLLSYEYLCTVRILKELDVGFGVVPRLGEIAGLPQCHQGVAVAVFIGADLELAGPLGGLRAGLLGHGDQSAGPVATGVSPSGSPHSVHDPS